MPEFALQTDPSQQVCFESEKLGSEPVNAVIKITNTTSETVAWKVKCTSNEIFPIHPPVGMLAPQKSDEVTVIFNSDKTIPEDSKHYFVVYYISAKDDLSAKKPPRQLWAENANTVPEGSRRLYVSFKKQSSAAAETKETKKDDDKKDETKKDEDKEEDKKAAEEGTKGSAKENTEKDGDKKDSKVPEKKEEDKKENDSKKDEEPNDDKKDGDTDGKEDGDADDKKEDAIVLKVHSTDPKELLSTNVKEYRFAMPLTLDEYERGQRYSVAKASLKETGGGQGVELLENEPFTSDTLRPGQVMHGTFTRKVYHLKQKAPWFMQRVFPDTAFDILEESWNAFPYTKTVLTNPGYMKENFHIIIETLHTDEHAILENALYLSDKLLRKRTVVDLDIYNEHDLKESDMSPLTDPRVFHSINTGRGPLTANWSDLAKPRIRLYKLCHVYFKWFGLQNKVERSIQDTYPRLFTKFNREMFCWIDEWHVMSSEELDRYEREVAEKLRDQFVNGSVVGMQANELA